MSEPVLSANNIHKSYIMGGHPLVVLRGASLLASEGEFLAVSGASGSGKSTLLHILGALDVPDDGQVVIDGTDAAAASDSSSNSTISCRNSTCWKTRSSPGWWIAPSWAGSPIGRLPGAPPRTYSIG